MPHTVDWNQVRQQYRLPNECLYFNNSSFGAMSDQTIAVQMDCLKRWQTEGNQLNERTSKAADEIRQLVSDMTGAQEYQVALIPDVSTGMNHLAELLHQKQKIALLKEDYPATSTPWIVRKFEITWVERKGFSYATEDIEKVIQSGIEVLVLSWVMYNSGTKLDLKEIGDLCRKHQVTFIVDATQGLLVNPVDLKEIHADVVLASAFKWMLAGYGIAIALASNEFVEQHHIAVAGQNTIINGEKSAEDLQNYRQGIQRFELGHAKIQPVLALENSLKELKEIGFENIQQRTAYLRSCLATALQANNIEILTPEPSSNSILMIEGTASRIEKLKQAKVGFTHRHGLIRMGIYFYNNEDDISRLIQVLN